MISFKAIASIFVAAAALTSAAPSSNAYSHNHKKQVVPGKYFDHFMVILLENQNYEVNALNLSYYLMMAIINFVSFRMLLLILILETWRKHIKAL
jgi:hypothetical protein